MKTSARSSFSGGTRKYLPNFCTKGRPSQRLTPYVMADPSHDPNVPARITPQMSILPCAARKAAGGMTTSLGTGKIELSIAIRMMTPQ